MGNKNKKQNILPPGVKSVADIPIPKQLNYETSLQLAWGAFENADFAERCEAASADWDRKRKTASLKILNRQIEITPASKEIIFPDGQKSAPWEKIIPLHYLKTATGTKPSGKLISYKEIPDGRLYWPNFVKRTHDILLKAFGSNPEILHDVANVVAGEPFRDKADAAIRVKALPRVDIILQLWKGDDEFSPEAAVLFDSSITDYLPTEDITVLSQMLAIKLMIASRK